MIKKECSVCGMLKKKVFECHECKVLTCWYCNYDGLCFECTKNKRESQDLYGELSCHVG